jgi:hypothetical protein
MPNTGCGPYQTQRSISGSRGQGDSPEQSHQGGRMPYTGVAESGRLRAQIGISSDGAFHASCST